VLRTTGRTGFMLWGTAGSLVLNICLIVLLSETLGLIGPATAFLVAEVALEIFYGSRMSKTLGLSFRDLADWLSIARIGASCVISFPILIGFEFVPGFEVARAVIAGVLYFSVVLLLAYRFGVTDIGRVAGFLWSRFHRSSIG